MTIIQTLLLTEVLAQPAHKVIEFDGDRIPHPKKMGFRKDFGAPVGQSEDYRLLLKDGRSIHAQKHGKRWRFHWDRLDPMINGFEHLRVDAPEYYTLAVAGIGVGLGSAVGAGIGALSDDEDDWKIAAFIGILVGAIFGLILALLTARWD